MTKSFLNNPAYANFPRGIRNNNIGNIRFSNANNWVGKVPYSQNTDSGKAFEQFTHVHFGIRAKMVLIYNKINSGKNTIAKFISDYAPAFENDTVGYINQVVSMTGIDKNAVIELNEDTLIAICKAICYVENGAKYSAYITDADYKDAIAVFDKPLKKKSKNNNTLIIAIALLAVAVVIYKINKKK